MTAKYDQIAGTNYLSDLCKDGTPLRGRIALLSFPSDISAKRIDTAIILIEYAQLLALFLRSAYLFYTEQATNSVEIYNVFIVFVKVFSPGNLLPFNKNSIQIINRVIDFSLAFYLLRISLFFYVIWLAFKRKAGSRFLIKSWQWIFYLQTKVFFHVFTSSYVNIYAGAFSGSLGVNSNHRYTYMAACLIMIALEFAFSLVLTTQLTSVLPFKRFSASKNNSLELNVLSQKFVNHVLRRIFSLSMTVSLWTYGSMNILFSLARIYQFFHKLPLYNYRALKLQLYLLIITFTLSIASFANVAVDWEKSNMNFIIIFWIILTIFCIPIANASLDKKLWNLVFEKGINTKRNPETLVHKIIFIKQIIRENKQPTKNSSKSDIYHLLWSTLTQTTPVLNALDLENKTTRNKIFMNYLDDLMAQFPKNHFLKLYSAYRYARKNKLYGLSIKILAELNDSNYPTVVTSKSILKHFIQTKTQSDYQNGAEMFNLYDYCKSVAYLSNLKLKMAEQAKLQWTLCHQIESVGPDLAEILRLGNKAYSMKQQIQKKFQKMSDQMPDWFIKPSLLYAYYNLFMEYSSKESEKYKEIYSKKFQKYHKQFENDKLISENLFQDDTFIIVISGEKETAGLMNYLSPGLMEIFGRNLTGIHASVITPPFIRQHAVAVVKSLMGPNALIFQNILRSNYFYHVKGYMCPINYYLNINPSIYGGLSFIFICRTASDSKDYILLNEEGEIETFTKNIGEALGLLSSSKDGSYNVEAKTPISQICPEFLQVNQAFNLVASSPGASSITEKTSTTTLEEAKEIYRVYSEEGKDITLTSTLKTHLQYHCLMKPLVSGGKVGKIMTLEKIHTSQNQEAHHLSKREETFENPEGEDLREDANSEWINFDRLKSEPQITLTARNENYLTSSRHLISSPRIPLMTERGITETKERLLLKEDDQVANSTNWNEILPQFNTQEKKNSPDKHRPRWLKNDQPKVSKLYKQALDKPYRYPLFYRGFITGLYALFLMVFVMYLYICINMHQGISQLQVSKQILRMAAARNNYLGILDSTTRFLWTYATSPSTLAKYEEGALISLPVLIYANQYTVALLETENDNLYDLTSSLNEDQRDDLFQKDVRMFDSNATTSLDTYISLTSFQATDRIIESSLKSFDLILTNIKSAVPYLKFILNNMLNDMLVKNAQISKSFIDSLHDKKNYFEGWITVCFSFSLCFLIFIVIGYLYVLYLQAKSESKNLFALTKLKPEFIHNLKQDFLIFHDLVLEDNQSDKFSNSSDPFSQIATLKRTKQQQQQSRQFPIYKGLWSVYYLYFLKVGLLILVPMIVFLANFVLFKKYLNQLSTKATQLSFIEEMNSRFGVLSGSFLEVTAENDTTLIYNQKASIALSYQISQISGMIQSVSDTLGVGASEENNLIQDILYGDACSYIKALPYNLGYCQALANYQDKAGLVNLLSNLESSIKLVYTNFFNSNRTTEVLLSLQVQAYNEITSPVLIVVQDLNGLIATELNNDFEKIVNYSQSLNITLNAVILVIVVVESLIIHFLIINRLKQKETQFKQILGLFPASVVLPNFILKSYITKASNQTFNSFRDNAE